MVVRKQDACAAMLCCIGNDGAHREVYPVVIPMMAAQVHAAGPIVQVGDPQAFASPILFGKTACEELACRSQSIKPQRGFGTLTTHHVHLA